MVSIYKKKVGQKRFQHVKNCRDYKKAWVYVCEQLMDLDYRLYYGYSLQYLGDGYTKKRVFPFASHEVTRKGIVYRIKI